MIGDENSMNNIGTNIYNLADGEELLTMSKLASNWNIENDCSQASQGSKIKVTGGMLDVVVNKVY